MGYPVYEIATAFDSHRPFGSTAALQTKDVRWTSSSVDHSVSRPVSGCPQSSDCDELATSLRDAVWPSCGRTRTSILLVVNDTVGPTSMAWARVGEGGRLSESGALRATVYLLAWECPLGELPARHSERKSWVLVTGLLLERSVKREPGVNPGRPRRCNRAKRRLYS